MAKTVSYCQNYTISISCSRQGSNVLWPASQMALARGHMTGVWKTTLSREKKTMYVRILLLISFKLDGVGPVDNRPSTD